MVAVEVFTAHFCAFDALTIDTANAWFTLSTGLRSHIAPEEPVHLLPWTVVTPFPVLVPDILPGGNISRQQSPLTPRSGTGEDGVQHVPAIDRSLLARPVRLRDVRGNQRTFPSIPITCVAFGRVWCGRPAGVAAGHRGYLPA